MKPSQAMAKWDSHSPGATYEPSESLDCMAKLDINRYSTTISAEKIITFLHHFFFTLHYCPVKILDLEINQVDHHHLGR